MRLEKGSFLTIASAIKALIQIFWVLRTTDALPSFPEPTISMSNLFLMAKMEQEWDIVQLSRMASYPSNIPGSHPTTTALKFSMQSHIHFGRPQTEHGT